MKEGWGEGWGLGQVVVMKKRSLICKPLNLCVSEVPPWSRVKGSYIFLSFCFSQLQYYDIVQRCSWKHPCQY